MPIQRLRYALIRQHLCIVMMRGRTKSNSQFSGSKRCIRHRLTGKPFNQDMSIHPNPSTHIVKTRIMPISPLRLATSNHPIQFQHATSRRPRPVSCARNALQPHHLPITPPHRPQHPLNTTTTAAANTPTPTPSTATPAPASAAKARTSPRRCVPVIHDSRQGSRRCNVRSVCRSC